MTPTRFRTRGQRGAALLIVIVVLAALMIIATPFAISMRLQERGSRNQAAQARAEIAAESVGNWAKAYIFQTCRARDPHPEYDTIDEFTPDLSAIDGEMLGLATKNLQDPYGTIVDVEVQDEQAKINANSATPIP